MKGYKAFNSDWKCRDKRYKVGETFIEDVMPDPCEKGMHFCERLPDVFKFYPFDPERTKVAEVESLGDVVTDDDIKFCTNKLHIIREIPWEEVQKACNTGDCNTGDRNTGNWNTGDCNTGDRNTGNWNTGNWNTGDCNTGNWNTGNWNTGNCNTGNWNKSSFNNGCFMTVESKIMMFNKPSEWTLRDWWKSRACALLNQIPKNVVEWVGAESMTDEEKAEHPEYKTTDGYLKVLDESDAAQIWWDGLGEEDRKEMMSLPNFDADIFRECTGIQI